MLNESQPFLNSDGLFKLKSLKGIKVAIVNQALTTSDTNSMLYNILILIIA